MSQNQTRLLLHLNQEVRLKAVLPGLHTWEMDSLSSLVDSLSTLLNADLCVVLSVDAWGKAPDERLSANCCDDMYGCSAGHLECPASEHEFAQMLKHLERVQS
jgi:hypothetical protein